MMLASETAILEPAALSTRRRVRRGDEGHGKVVGIVGAGFSGTMAAIHLRRALPPDWVVVLFDRTGRFARGPAYAETGAPHLLNVRSANMSALPDDPGHFERWLASQAGRWPGEVQVTEAGTFASRRLYGRYLRALLYDEMTLSGGRVRLCSDDVTSLDPTGLDPAGTGWRITCASGRTVTAAAVVIASGTLPSSQPCDGVVFHDPWAAGATAGLRPGEPVLIVGTGLTMVDLVLAMHARGFDGPVIALSRRGLVPKRHTPPGPAWPCPPFDEGERRSLSPLLRAVRRRVREAVAHGVDWRAMVDGMRPVTAGLWQDLPQAERSRFLRHLRPYWDAHRHRMAPVVAEAFDGLLARGVLRLKRGRVLEIALQKRSSGSTARVVIQDRGEFRTEEVVVQRVIYATGIGAGAATDGLVAQLVGTGLARTDPHGMGVEVTSSLQATRRDGSPAPGLWALGPIVRGVFWECTAVPDIRVQAHTVAKEVARVVLEAMTAQPPIPAKATGCLVG
ncbi:MAG: FAD/NAD(P)-binding protein [Janthinobacterium lividum]